MILSQWYVHNSYSISFTTAELNEIHLNHFQANEERLDTPDISDQMYQMALKLIVFFEKVDRKHSIDSGIDIETYEKSPKPSVLVFLPGIYEIKQMHQRLDEWCYLYAHLFSQLFTRLIISLFE